MDRGAWWATVRKVPKSWTQLKWLSLHTCTNVYLKASFFLTVTNSKARKFQKNIYFCFIDNAKAFDCVNHNKLWKILKEMGIPDHLTCLLRKVYAYQEAIVRTGHGKTDWFQIGKGVRQGCILSSCLFNIHAETYICT